MTILNQRDMNSNPNRRNNGERARTQSLGVSGSGIADGGGAYPRPRSSGVDERTGAEFNAWAQTGMTVRDAMAIAVAPTVTKIIFTKNDGALDSEEISRISYHIADAMMRERVK